MLYLFLYSIIRGGTIPVFYSALVISDMFHRPVGARQVPVNTMRKKQLSIIILQFTQERRNFT